MPNLQLEDRGWDNWMILYQKKCCSVDATSCFTAIHQNHDYSHPMCVETYEGFEAIKTINDENKPVLSIDDAIGIFR